MNIVEVSIIAPPAGEVNSGNAMRHTRISREDVVERDIAPEIRARSRHVAHCVQKRQTVRVPAMRVSEWGQFLRGLELKRALA
ncbi:Uncharacterized protein EbC_pEb17201780 (plasmid) [Erwinia billingiae Eb661]|uniref:Uncharacterized protein n=1 Tax=Erwinia billingiae (strain Eb661) TaxID=634500 RepID=D8MK33_ERWBE|nr:hypothetical protein [Erwinia billingiae]CAX53631.1 Uncharacterized protein EbC_pEb17201780 [Erwinia billingiae Eb661]